MSIAIPIGGRAVSSSALATGGLAILGGLAGGIIGAKRALSGQGAAQGLAAGHPGWRRVAISALGGAVLGASAGAAVGFLGEKGLSKVTGDYAAFRPGNPNPVVLNPEAPGKVSPVAAPPPAAPRVITESEGFYVHARNGGASGYQTNEPPAGLSLDVWRSTAAGTGGNDIDHKGIWQPRQAAGGGWIDEYKHPGQVMVRKLDKLGQNGEELSMAFRTRAIDVETTKNWKFPSEPRIATLHNGQRVLADTVGRVAMAQEGFVFQGAPDNVRIPETLWENTMAETNRAIQAYWESGSEIGTLPTASKPFSLNTEEVGSFLTDVVHLNPVRPRPSGGCYNEILGIINPSALD